MLSELSLFWLFAIFAVAVVFIGIAGTKLSFYADVLGERLHMGKAVTGALFLGAVTSLSGIITSITSALQGYPTIAVSNAIGGIAAQTVFLAVADMCYRRANLEHDAASASNMLQGTLLLVVLTLALMAFIGPEVDIWGIHLGTPVLLLSYLAGMRMLNRASEQPMWYPSGGAVPGVDQAAVEEGAPQSLAQWWLIFAGLAAVVAISGWLLATCAGVIGEDLGLQGGLVGGLGTAIPTSLPELVTTIAAVRRGALTLAVGGILGGNAFDVLFLAGADIAYTDGSIYHAVGAAPPMQIATTILMVGVLLMGLLRRERSGVANIGFESALIVLIYLASTTLLAFWPGV